MTRSRPRSPQPSPKWKRLFRPCLEPLEDRLAPATFRVIDLGDTASGSGGAGSGSDGDLRYCLTQANGNVGLDTIQFAIPGAGPHTINLLATLPEITDAVFIDGYTQSGAVANSLASGNNAVLRIVLSNGTGQATVNGLDITSAGSTIRGLVINGFQYGIDIRGASASGNTIAGNFIGTNVTGTTAQANNGGVALRLGAHDNTIGGSTPADRNVISGNTQQGVEVSGSGTTSNVIAGNHIGTNLTGTTDLGNTKQGIYIHSGADGNTVGGTTSAFRNVISGNNEGGVTIETASNVVQGNYIGMKADGLVGLPNTSTDALRGHGVRVTGADNLIGGATSSPGTGAGNIISTNGTGGVGASGVGVWVEGAAAAGTRIEGNIIGSNLNGVAPGGFQAFGVLAHNGATDVTIGGTAAGVRNVISGNGAANIQVSDDPTTGIVIQGNYIGTNLTGTAGIAGANYGIHLSDSGGNLVGGTTAAARNLISGNSTDGIRITNQGASLVGNTIQGNWIGLDATGTSAIANRQSGIAVVNSRNNLIGGTAPGAGNVISGGAAEPVGQGIGIRLVQTSNHNTVQGNFIGTDATGTLDVGNKIGIQIRQDLASLIGGTTAAARNIISGNDDFGILVTYVPSRAHRIQGNWVGLNVNGEALPNGVGIQFEDGAETNLVGTRGYDGEVFSQAPRLYWRLDEAAGAATANNLGSLGAAANGTYQGSVALGQPGALAGVSNTAARFGDGVNDAVSDGTFGMFTNAFSFEAWVRSSSTANQQTIVSYAVAGSSNEFALISTNHELGIYLNSNSDVIDGVTSVNTGVDVVDGQWHHVVVSWVAGSGALILYKDGKEVYSGTLQAGNSLSTNGSLVLAQDQDSVGGGFDAAQRFIGTLDEVAIYGQLDDHEVSANYDVGAHAGGQNVISGNTGSGVVITGGTFNSHHIVVAGNFIGTNPAGTAALPNGGDGVEIRGGAHTNTIGGTTAAAGNVISGNRGSGVEIAGASTTGNVVQRNRIGTNATGTTDLGNDGDGVLIHGGASGNTVGGTTSGVGNTIAHNSTGVMVLDAGSTGNRILGNAIVANTGLGIDLGGDGVTANGTGTVGPNNLMARPVLTRHTATRNNHEVVGELTAAPSTTYRVEFFSNSAEDAEGEVYLGSRDVTTDGTGFATFQFSFAPGAAPSSVTSTMTNPAGDTSEFSAAAFVTFIQEPEPPPPPPPPSPPPSPPPPQEPEPAPAPPPPRPEPESEATSEPEPEPTEELASSEELEVIERTGGSEQKVESDNPEDSTPTLPGESRSGVSLEGGGNPFQPLDNTTVVPSVTGAVAVQAGGVVVGAATPGSDRTVASPETQSTLQAIQIVAATLDGDDSFRLFETLLVENGLNSSIVPIRGGSEENAQDDEQAGRVEQAPLAAAAETHPVPLRSPLVGWLAAAATAAVATSGWLWGRSRRRNGLEA